MWAIWVVTHDHEKNEKYLGAVVCGPNENINVQFWHASPTPIHQSDLADTLLALTRAGHEHFELRLLLEP